MRSIVVCLMLVSSAAAQDISGGVMEYSPDMAAIREQFLMAPTDPTGWYVRLRLPARVNLGPKDMVVAEHRPLWGFAYTGCSADGQVSVDVHALEVSVLAEGKKAVTHYVGFGPSFYYVRAEDNVGGEEDQTELLYGAHAVIGLRARTAAVGVDVGWTYSWSRESRLYGTKFGLGDSRWYAGVALGN